MQVLPVLSEDVALGGKTFVVLTEDRGGVRRQIAVSVFEGGELVHRKIVSYADLAQMGISDEDKALTAAMRGIHNSVVRDLKTGGLRPSND